MSATERPGRCSYLTVSQDFALNHACHAIDASFEYGTFLVGSAITRPDWRDVDLRCIMPDAEYDVLFKGHETRLKFLNVAVSDWISARTSLPIDFQFQQATDANARFKGCPRSHVGGRLPEHYA